MSQGKPRVEQVVLDTNVFVAAGFRPHSASGWIVDGVRQGRLRMIWDEATRRETRFILEKIPPLSWTAVADLFRPDNEYMGQCLLDAYSYVPDPDDRKYIALAEATGALLITNDDHLLGAAHRAPTVVLTPAEFRTRFP